MKKLLLAMALIASSANAAYIDYGYSSPYNLKEDAQLLAQASLLLKGSDGTVDSYQTDQKLKSTIARQCKGIKAKWKITKQPTIYMTKIKTKVDAMCAQWGQ